MRRRHFLRFLLLPAIAALLILPGLSVGPSQAAPAPSSRSPVRVSPAPSPPGILRVDGFEGVGKTNLVGGPSDTFSTPGAAYCQASIVAIGQGAARNHALRLKFDTTERGAYGGYWTALMAADLRSYNALALRLHTAADLPPMLIGLRHAPTRAEAKVPLKPYCSEPDPEGWRGVVIPLSAFRGRGLADLSLMDAVTVTFENRLASGAGTLLLDDLQFRRGAAFPLIADFDRFPMEQNVLGGGFRAVAKGAAAISAGYHEEKTPARKVGTVRISYGGSIGRDDGEGQRSSASWETDLMGVDARGFQYVVLKLRGERGGEQPNVYLDDGATRHPVHADDFAPLTTAWQEVRIPLEKFARQGVDLSHLEALQLGFESPEMSGTLYIAQIRFDGAASARATPSGRGQE